MTETVNNLMEANLLGVFNERDAQRRAVTPSAPELLLARTGVPDRRCGLVRLASVGHGH
jgi:hypothetical protein